MLQHEMNVVFRLVDLIEFDYVFMIQLSKKTDFLKQRELFIGIVTLDLKTLTKFLLFLLSTFFSIVLIANFSELF